MQRTIPPTLSDDVAAFLDQHEVHFIRHDRTRFEFHLVTDATAALCDLDANDERRSIRLAAAISIRVRPEFFGDVTACFNVLNAGLSSGAWFINPDHGWMCLRLDRWIPTAEAAAEEIPALLARVLGLLDAAAPALCTLAFAGGDPFQTAETIMHSGEPSPLHHLQVPEGVRPELN